MAEVTLHVQTIFIADISGARGEGAADLLRLVWYAHAGRAADQSPEDATVQQEHSYAVAEEGFRGRKPMWRGRP